MDTDKIISIAIPIVALGISVWNSVAVCKIQKNERKKLSIDEAQSFLKELEKTNGEFMDRFPGVDRAGDDRVLHSELVQNKLFLPSPNTIPGALGVEGNKVALLYQEAWIELTCGSPSRDNARVAAIEALNAFRQSVRAAVTESRK